MSVSVSSVLDPETERLLSEGKAAARRGDKVMARALLGQVVEREPRTEEAWMWLSGVVGDLQEQQICLENVLVVNPYNEQARKGLEYISAKTGVPARVPEMPPPPEPQLLPADSSVSQPNSADSLPWLQNALNGAGKATGNATDDGTDTGTGQSSHGLADQEATPTTEGAAEQSVAAPALADTPTPTPDNGFPAELAARLGALNVQDGQPAPEREVAAVGNTISIEDLDPSIEVFAPPTDTAQISSGLTDSQRTATGLPSSPKLEVPSWLDQITPQSEPAVPVEESSQYVAPTAPSLPEMPLPPAPAPDPTPLVGDSPSIDAGRNMSPLGPFTDLHLPTPEELPGNDHLMKSQAPQAQPWYLQSSGGSIGMPPAGGMNSPQPHGATLSDYGQGGQGGQSEAQPQQRAVATMECPNCKEQVPETSLACPNCRFQFFVNCPHCHELVDAATAKPGVSESCPYCGVTINKMDLALSQVHGAIPYESVSANDVASAYPAMQQFTVAEPAVRHGFSFAWVVDLLWLITIVAVIWALTQLPIWLHLTGQY